MSHSSQKKNPVKSYEHAKLIKYFSEWDYEFQYIYDVALDRHLEQVGLYLRVRELILKTDFIKTKRDMLSGVSTELGRRAGRQRAGPTWPRWSSRAGRKKLWWTGSLQLSRTTTSGSRRVRPKSTTGDMQHQRGRVLEDLPNYGGRPRWARR